MRRFRMHALVAMLALTALPGPSHAAVHEISMTGTQFTPGGYVSWSILVNQNAATPPGTPHDPIVVKQGDIIRFVNRDAFAHHPGSIPGQSPAWEAVHMSAGLSTWNLAVSASRFSKKRHEFTCYIHTGMRAAFVVT